MDQEIIASRQKFISDNNLVVGTIARFFHPRTMGVMYRGKIVKIKDTGMVNVKFDVDDSVWMTFPDFISRE